MGQKEICEPPCGRIGIQPMKNRIEYGIEEKRKWTYHYHNLKGHDEEYDNATLRDNTLAPFFNV
jgi:hypothetical protein